MLGSVCVSYLYPRDVSGRFCDSLAGMLLHDRKFQRIKTSMSMMSGPRVAEARSQLVEKFLVDCDEDWLLMLDTDMTFEPDLCDRLLKSAKKVEADVIGGLCFAGHSWRMFPTIYELYTMDDGMAGVRPIRDYPRNATVKVGATGGACLLMSRSILKRMTAPWPKGFGTTPSGKQNVYPWFVEGGTNPNGAPFGEDCAFCMRVNAMDGGVYVDTSVKLGHLKELELDEQLWDANFAHKELEMGTG